MTEFHLAQLNVARLAAPLDSPQLAPFVDRLDEINALAESSPGFVWRYVADGTNNATDDRSRGDDELLNLSVWGDVESLWQFVFRSSHLDSMRDRRQFFVAPDGPVTVLWWIPAGTLPTTDEAAQRLVALRARGPHAEAFDFRHPFGPDGEPAASAGHRSG